MDYKKVIAAGLLFHGWFVVWMTNLCKINPNTMKKKFYFLSHACYIAFMMMIFSQAASAQDYPMPPVQDNYWIDSLKIIPQKAYAGDIISVAAYTTHSSGDCGLKDYRIWKCQDFIFVDATYEQGMLTYICHSADTIPLGTFSTGNYTLFYDWLDTIRFRVYPNPQDCRAYFTYTYAKCLDAKCINTVAFQDSSKGDVVSWFWEFGDENTSKEKNPVHAWAKSGIYDVCLKIVTSDGCSDTYCERVPVGVTNRCKADFTWEPLRCSDVVSRCPGFYQFMDLSKGDPIKWYWNFGDGDTSTFQNPLHAYDSDGRYVVSLVIYTSSGCSDIKLDTIVVGDSVPHCCSADFGWEEVVPLWNCQPEWTNCITPYYYVQFKDMSMGPVWKWEWDFGDGSVSTEQNPFHEYKYTGTYDVCLKIICSGWCYDVIRKIITVGDTIPGQCKADFTVDPEEPACMCPACYCVRFIDQSSWNTVEWLWSFGDCDTSVVKNPQHTYFWIPGEPLFKVCLKIRTSDNCVDSVCKMYDPESGTLVSGFNEIPQPSEELSLYPNPASGEIHVQLLQEILNKKCLITIMDMYGRQLGVYSYDSGETIDGTVSLNVANLNNGQYICTVIADNKLYKCRFTVTK
jgi:PKD repeat protein